MLPGGTNDKQQGKIELLSLWALGRLSFAIEEKKQEREGIGSPKQTIKTSVLLHHQGYNIKNSIGIVFLETPPNKIPISLLADFHSAGSTS